MMARMRIELGDWESMRQWAEPLRFAVFVEEQRVPAEMRLTLSILYRYTPPSF